MAQPEPARPASRGSHPPTVRDPMDALIRRERKVRKLPPNAACVFCGETNPIVLEVHHLAGVANEPDKTSVLCLNHHRTQSARQRGAGIELNSEGERMLPDRLIAWLRGLGLLFTGLAGSCIEMADRLATFSLGLDAHCPAWRTMPEADR